MTSFTGTKQVASIAVYFYFSHVCPFARGALQIPSVCNMTHWEMLLSHERTLFMLQESVWKPCVCVCVGSIFYGNFPSGCLCSICEIEMSTWHMSRADYRVYEKLLEKKIKMLCSCGNIVPEASSSYRLPASCASGGLSRCCCLRTD